MKAFGQGGAGLFAGPTAIARILCDQYGVRPVGRIEDVHEELYAITTERRLSHPAIVAISQAAQHQVFGGTGPRRWGRGQAGATRPAKKPSR